MMALFKQNKKMRLLVFGIFVAGLSLSVFLLTPPGRSLLGLDDRGGSSHTECKEISGIAISDPACRENFEDGKKYQFIPMLGKKAMKLGSIDTTITMGNFSFGLGDLYADYYNLNGIDYSYTLSLPVRFTHSGASDGFGAYTPNFNLLLVLTGMKSGSVLYHAALRFKPAYDYYCHEPEYYKADFRLNREGIRIPLTGDNPPWETQSAQMVLMCQLFVQNEDEIDADRIVVSYAALRTQICERVYTVYDRNSDSFSRNDYSIDDYVYGLAEEDDFGTRYIIAKNVNTVYFQLIDPDCFTKREYSHITLPSERETETEKYDRYFYSIVKRVLG